METVKAKVEKKSLSEGFKSQTVWEQKVIFSIFGFLFII